jgi:hypothetical protein
MRDPNFGEGQLQQAVNSAIRREVFGVGGSVFTSNMPTLRQETDLGWDTGVYFPWFSYSSLTEHDGRNFFIQYKLSNLLTSSGASQYRSWRSPYMRFRIPYNDKCKNDYSQFRRLRLLADKGHPTYYATNSVVELKELERLEQGGELLAKTPFLDVRHIAAPSVYATFTKNSSEFALHDNEQRCELLPWSTIESKLQGAPMYSLAESNENLLNKLAELGQDNDPAAVSQCLESYPEEAPMQALNSSKSLEAYRFFYLKAVYLQLFGISVHRYSEYLIKSRS